MKKIYVILLIAALLLMSCAPQIQNTPAVNYDPPEWLTVSNKHIVTKKTGQITVLKGVTFTGGVWFYTSGNPSAAAVDSIQFMQSESDFAKMKSLGANVVNFYMNYYWFTGAEKSKGYAFIDKLLLWCRKYGLYLLPSITVYPVGGLRGGSGFFYNSAAMDSLKQFWIEFAGKYKDHAEIAGYDILNEPNGCTPDILTNYQLELIDAIRAVETNHAIFIEPYYGDEDNLYAFARPSLVYNIHYYKPYYYTSQGMPWMASGGIPTNLTYPGTFVSNTYEVRSDYFPAAPAGTYSWTQVTIQTNAPAGANYLFAQVFCNADSGASVWFDDIEFSTNGGATYIPIANGSFEIKNETTTAPLYWKVTQYGAGVSARTNSAAHSGSYSAFFSGQTGWGEFQTWDWIATMGGVPVTPGETVYFRFWVKANNASASMNGMQFKWIKAESYLFDKAWLERSIDKTVQFMTLNSVPVFVGEFSPALVGKRPDILNYISDVISIFNTNGFNWTYYPYRETWTGNKYMGIYNGAYGVPTSGCAADQEILTLISNSLSGN